MLLPQNIAEKFIETGKSKAALPPFRAFLLSIMAGIFIAIAGVGATVGAAAVPAAAKLVSACIFPAGLAMVILAGSELFTGNSLMFISVLQKEIRFRSMLKNWLIVYVGNFVGALIIAFLAVYSDIFSAFSGTLAESVVSTAGNKASLDFGAALIRGILCNLLVCIAVWLATAADTAHGKIISLFFPIMIFVLCGFEHSVANMYYIPAGLLASLKYGIEFEGLSVASMFGNLIPVTIGNIIGGALMVALPYKLIYLGKAKKD